MSHNRAVPVKATRKYLATMASSLSASRIEVEYICRNSVGLTLPSYFSGKGLELLRLDHHAEVWGKHHAATPRSRQRRWGASGLPHRSSVHRIKVPIEVATLVVVPLPLVNSMVMWPSSPD
jgi:hypothetical protein